MAVAIARRLLLAPARCRGGFWSAAWSADTEGSASAAVSDPSQSSGTKKKKLSPSSSSSAAQHRLGDVVDTINERKLPPELRGRPNALRSETDIINVVEQRICHSIEEGHFENLPGKGKPLNLDTNPHADPAEDTLYRKNGCAPECVELNMEIHGRLPGWWPTLRKCSANRSEDDGCAFPNLRKSLRQMKNDEKQRKRRLMDDLKAFNYHFSNLYETSPTSFSDVKTKVSFSFVSRPGQQ